MYLPLTLCGEMPKGSTTPAAVYRNSLEDSISLTELLSSAGSRMASTSSSEEQLEACATCLRWFLEEGWIELLRNSGWPDRIETTLTKSEALEILQDVDAWKLRHDEEPPTWIAYSSTELGATYFRDNRDELLAGIDLTKDDWNLWPRYSDNPWPPAKA